MARFQRHFAVSGSRADPAPCQHRGEDTHVVTLGARRPRAQRQPAQPRDLRRVGDLYGLTADHDAPAGVGGGVGPVDLERNPAAPDRGVQLGSVAGAQHHHVAVEDEVDRKHHWPTVVDNSHPAQMLAGQQLEALRLR